MPVLTVHSAGPGVTVQDLGRTGWTAQGLSRGGAADRLALLEAAALLDQDTGLAVLEMAGFGGVFSTDRPLRIALTGALMQADIDGVPVPPQYQPAVSGGCKTDHRRRAGGGLRLSGLCGRDRDPACHGQPCRASDRWAGPRAGGG
jgi:Allophanate hydrolase subunit 2